MHDFFSSARPLLLSNYNESDPRFDKYNFDFLRRHCSEIEVTASRFASGAERKFSIKEYLDYMDAPEEPDPFYIHDWQYWHHPEVFSGIDPLDVTENWLDRLPSSFCPRLSWMFIGKKGTHSSLHVDLLHTSAWNLLLEGEKHWFFFPPDFDFPDEDMGKTDVRARAYRTDPRVIELIQKKGGIVYTPPLWYHQVFNNSNSFAITENFLNAANYEAVYDFFDSRNESNWKVLLKELKAVMQA